MRLTRRVESCTHSPQPQAMRAASLRPPSHGTAELDAELDKYWQGHRDEGLTMEEHNTMVLELWSEKKYLETEAIPYWQHADATLNKALSDYRDKVVANDPSVGSRLRPPSFSGPEPWEGPTEADARAMLQEVFSTLARASGGSD